LVHNELESSRGLTYANLIRTPVQTSFWVTAFGAEISTSDPEYEEGLTST